MILNATSNKKLSTVDPLLREVIEYAASTAPSNIDFQIVQGLRTQAEQNALYAQGRTKPGKIVTWTRNSNHMSGDAVDFQAYVNGKATWDEKAFIPVAQHIKKAAAVKGIKIQWGYDMWKKDYGHIQLVPGQTVDIKKEGRPADPSPLASWAQKRLNAWGFYGLKEDGNFGPASQKALLDFQIKEGLMPSLGKVDAATEAKLKEPSRAERAVVWFVKKGMSKIAAVALVGGFQQESYKRLDPKAHGDKEEADNAYGVAQWRADRRMRLDLLAKQRGTEWNDFDTQLQHAWNELQTTEKRTGKLLKEAKTIDQAAKAAIGFFRPAGFTWDKPENGHGFANRLKNAKDLYRLVTAV
jgi:peptidoglycan hydrolase-like protein with peptidoglycan-binding domain